MPWVWLRRMLAARWNIPPWVVDNVPIEEIFLELRLMELYAEAIKKKADG